MRCKSAEDSRKSRVSYSKVVRECLQFVIAEVGPDGTFEFWSQDAGEVRWFAFIPDERERAAVLELWRSPDAPERPWPMLRL